MSAVPVTPADPRNGPPAAAVWGGVQGDRHGVAAWVPAFAGTTTRERAAV
jgi:hypothetical protein